MDLFCLLISPSNHMPLMVMNLFSSLPEERELVTAPLPFLGGPHLGRGSLTFKMTGF